MFVAVVQIMEVVSSVIFQLKKKEIYQSDMLESACINSIANIKPEQWTSISKVVGSIPTVARRIFQACPVRIYTQSNITSIIFT